jgi:hypothetical protein
LGPFELASVLELGSADMLLPHAYTLAVRTGGKWYVAANYPVVDSIEGGMESLGLEVIGDPRIERGPSSDGGSAETAVLSLQETRCSWRKWTTTPSRTNTVAPVPTAKCSALLGDAGGSERRQAIVCTLGMRRLPVCSSAADSLGAGSPEPGALCANAASLDWRIAPDDVPVPKDH